MTLLADREISAVVSVVVAVVDGTVCPADVVARRTARFWRFVGIALTAVWVTGTVERVVVALVLCDSRFCSAGAVAGVVERNEVSADVAACALRQWRRSLRLIYKKTLLLIFIISICMIPSPDKIRRWAYIHVARRHRNVKLLKLSLTACSFHQMFGVRKKTAFSNLIPDTSAIRRLVKTTQKRNCRNVNRRNWLL